MKVSWEKINCRKALSLILCLTMLFNLFISGYYTQVVEAATAEDPNRQLGANDIPDSILFNKLKELADSNQDGKLLVGEMWAYTGDANGLLDLRNLNLTSIQGLGFAKGVKSIDLSGNDLINNVPDNTFLDCTSMTSIVLPINVGSIGASAFEGCSVLAGINLPDGLTSIGDKAFLGCKSLKSIQLPQLITTLGNSAFSGSGLASIDIPNPQVTMGVSIFNGCKDLKDVILPEGITAIPMETFKATAIESIIIPSSVKVIDSMAFDSTLLNSIDLSGNNNLTIIGNNAFSNTSYLKYVNLPESLSQLGYGAFENCISLPSIKIPSKITTLDDNTFSRCINLQKVEFTPEVINGINNYKLQTIKSKVFYQCYSLGGPTGVVDFLKDLNNLTSIGDYAFSSDAFTVIGSYDEYNQQLYTGITTVNLPDSLTQLGKFVFYNCYNLQTLTIPSKVTVINDNSFQNCYNLKTIDLPVNLTTIGNYSFDACRSLSNVTFPVLLNKIGSYAFKGCALQKYRTILNDAGAKVREYAYTGLTSLQLQDNVTDIGTGAFMNCYNLRTVTLPANLVQLNDYVFQGCAVQAVAPDGSLIPNQYIGLQSVNFPNKLVSIGNSTFASCKALTSIVIPYYLESIGTSAFYGCTNLLDVNMRSAANLKTIGSSAFSQTGISGLIRIPEKVTSISSSAFAGCPNITEVVLPDTLTSVGSLSFKDDIKLVSVTMPASATVVYSGSSTSFSGCYSLSNAIINPVPSDITVMENSQVELPVKCFSRINAVDSDNADIVLGDIIVPTTGTPKAVLNGIKAGQTTVTVRGTLEYEWGKDPVTGGIMVQRFETQVKFKVTVSAIKCTGVSFDQTMRGLKLSSTAGIKINAAITPADTTDIKTWTSDNELVAKVGSDGTVTPVGYGTAAIRLKVGEQPEAVCQVRVCAPASNLTIDKTDITLVAGKSAVITPTIAYSSTYDAYKTDYPEVVLWSTSDPNIATVDQNGNVTAVGYGEATITSKADAAGIIRQCKVTVIPESTDVSFDKSNLTILKGSTGQLTMTLNPVDSPLSKITVSSSNIAVATVTLSGNIITVNAKAGGTATITAAPVCGIAATCQVKVESPLTAIVAAPMQLTKGTSKVITLTKTPTDSTDILKYTSSNPSVATVDSTGKVTGVSGGSAVITIKSENGVVSADCQVTVISPVTGITLNTSTANLYNGWCMLLTASVAPDDVTNKAVTWYSSNSNVATVDSNGKVTGVGVGTTTITVITVDGYKRATCVVTVTTAPSDARNRDLNLDGTVDILDLAMAASSYNSTSGNTLYNANYDFNFDNIIDIYDFVLILLNFNK